MTAALREAIASTRAKYVPGTPERYPRTQLRGLTVLDAELLLARLDRSENSLRDAMDDLTLTQQDLAGEKALRIAYGKFLTEAQKDTAYTLACGINAGAWPWPEQDNCDGDLTHDVEDETGIVTGARPCLGCPGCKPELADPASVPVPPPTDKDSATGTLLPTNVPVEVGSRRALSDDSARSVNVKARR